MEKLPFLLPRSYFCPANVPYPIFVLLSKLIFPKGAKTPPPQLAPTVDSPQLHYSLFIPYSLATYERVSILYEGTFYEFEPEVALAPQWLREAFKKITILFLTFVNKGLSLTLEKNSYVILVNPQNHLSSNPCSLTFVKKCPADLLIPFVGTNRQDLCLVKWLFF